MVARVLWFVAGLVVVLQWYAVWSRRHALETLTKPAATAVLLVAAVASGLLDRDGGVLVGLGLVLGLIGDVLLLEHTDSRFLGGLASFLVGHLLYVAAFVQRGQRVTPWLVLGALTVLAALVVTRQVLPAVRRTRPTAFTAAVAAYIVVLALCAVTAAGTGRGFVAVGAALFVASDAMLARQRFVRAQPRGDLVVSVTYLLAQALIVGGFSIA